MTELIPPPVPKTAALDAAPAEVKAFVARHGLHGELGTALRLVGEAFPPERAIDLRLQFSPDHGCDRLIVNVTTPADVPTAVACHQNLLDRWTDELPARAQELLVSTFAAG